MAGANPGQGGGGSLQVVFLKEDKTILRDSLPLSAIRLFYLGEDEGGPWNESLVKEYIHSQLEEAFLPHAEEIYGTGGTLKAVCQVLKRPSFSSEEVAELHECVRKEGPPVD